MVNPSALGVAFLVVLATTTMVESSSSRQSFQIAHPSLRDLLSEDSITAMVGIYQRQQNTISLSQEGLGAAQRLLVQVPTGVTFRGTLAINGVVQQPITSEGITLDLRDFLASGSTQVTLEGTYDPPQDGIVVSFDNPDTTVRQQVGQQGSVDYHINFQVD